MEARNQAMRKFIEEFLGIEEGWPPDTQDMTYFWGRWKQMIKEPLTPNQQWCVDNVKTIATQRGKEQQ